MGITADISVDDGVRRGKSPPLRTCVVTRSQFGPERMLRFVAGPDDVIVPDLACRLPGRGVWVSLDRKTLETAIRTHAFAKSLKHAVRTTPDLPDLVDRLMVQRLGGALSLANKAGLVTTGFSRVDAAIGSGTPIALLHGSDASQDGIDKLDRRFAAMSRDLGRKPETFRTFTTEQMSLALGRANVVHAALMMGGAARHFLIETERLTTYRTGKPDVE